MEIFFSELLKGLPTLIGVLIGGTLTVFNSWFADRRAHLRSRSYSVVRIICLLENLISSCENIVSDEGDYDGGGIRNPIFKILKSVDFPQDIDWRNLDHQFTYPLLSLQTRLENANRNILKAREIDGPPDFDEYFIARGKEYSKLGLILVEILNKMSTFYDVQINNEDSLRAKELFCYILED